MNRRLGRPVIGKFFFHVNLLQINDVFLSSKQWQKFLSKYFFFKKNMSHSAAISRAKSPCEIFRGKLSKGHVQWQFVFNPLRPPSFIGPDKFEGLWTPSLELQELQGAAAGGPGMKLMVGESLGG